MSHKGINWDEQPLGDFPDVVIADIVGCNPATVARVRYRRNIPAYRVDRRRKFVEYGEFRKAQALIAAKLRKERELRENYVESIATLLLDHGCLIEDETAEEILEMILRYPIKEER